MWLAVCPLLWVLIKLCVVYFYIKEEGPCWKRAAHA
jgi:hypothetical protein